MIPIGKNISRIHSYGKNILTGFYCSKPSNDLLLTTKCVERLKQVLKNDEFLRVEVQGGGCSGFEYKFKFDNKIDKTQDLIFSNDGAKVVVDNISMEYLKGATLDYVSELLRTSFKIVKNPIAEKGCSCGSSFAPRLD
uniref:Iron-sulfur cluster assembly 2 homolog, mitochondrial n=1 Tax=Strongyloides venezuelensis TaxID=75913 RepID=A0A0K0G1G1_STRVS